MEEFKQKSELNKLIYLNEGCELNIKNEFILSKDLIKEGWKIGMGFQDKSNANIVSEEILRLRNSKYEVRGIKVKGMEHIKCLIYKEI